MRYAEVIELADGRWMLDIEGRGDTLGPLTSDELRAIIVTLEEWQEEQG